MPKVFSQPMLNDEQLDWSAGIFDELDRLMLNGETQPPLSGATCKNGSNANREGSNVAPSMGANADCRLKTLAFKHFQSPDLSRPSYGDVGDSNPAINQIHQDNVSPLLPSIAGGPEETTSGIHPRNDGAALREELEKKASETLTSNPFFFPFCLKPVAVNMPATTTTMSVTTRMTPAVLVGGPISPPPLPPPPPSPPAPIPPENEEWFDWKSDWEAKDQQTLAAMNIDRVIQDLVRDGMEEFTFC